MSLTLTPGQISFEELEAIYRDGDPLELADGARVGVDRAHQVIARAAAAPAPAYGVNTGFGKLASSRIPPLDTKTLQRNLILSHCCGVGDPLPGSVVRLMMTIKLASLARGASGVDWSLIAHLKNMVNRGVFPIIPRQGSVGASGDLAPLAHMTAVMIGEGEAEVSGKRMSGDAALKSVGLEPIKLAAKEGLALINGTQFSTAVALAQLFEIWRSTRGALVTGALTTDAVMGSSAPFRAEIQALRGHRGQIDAAFTLRRVMEGSEIRESHREGDERVQDPYCIRCQPQVVGAAIDLLRFAALTLVTEANAVTDNPLVVADDVISGGNFHGEPVAFAADQIALAVAELGAISQRRIALLVDPALSFGLPPFLTPDPGLNSGFMIAEVTSAALMSENKQRANPCSVDSTPTSANQEDHVSMSAHGACRLHAMSANLAQIVGIELMIAAQGVEMRAPLKTSPCLQRILEELRKHVPPLRADRYLAMELEKCANLIKSGIVIHLTGKDHFPSLNNTELLGDYRTSSA